MQLLTLVPNLPLASEDELVLKFARCLPDGEANAKNVDSVWERCEVSGPRATIMPLLCFRQGVGIFLRQKVVCPSVRGFVRIGARACADVRTHWRSRNPPMVMNQDE